MPEVHKYVFAGVKMIADQLTDEELNALLMVGLMGTDPRPVIGYDKGKALFTINDGTGMHSSVQDALVIIHDERIPQESEA